MAATKNVVLAKIEKLNLQLAKLQAELETAADEYTPKTGDVVRVRFGRGQTATEVQGTIRAFGPAVNGKGNAVAVEIGTDLDVKIVRVPAAAVLGLVVAPVADEAPAAE